MNNELFDKLWSVDEKEKVVIDKEGPKISYSSFDIFTAKLASDAGMDEQKLEDTLDLFAFIVENNLVSEVNMAKKDIPATWESVKYWQHNDQVAASALGQIQATKVNNFKSVQRILHDNATPQIEMGFDLTKSVEGLDNTVLQQILENPEQLVEDAIAIKNGQMKNAIKNVCGVFPSRVTRTLKTERQKSEFVDEVLTTLIEEQRFLYPPNYKKFKVPKESGVMLPHTMDPVSWVATSATKFVHSQYGKRMNVVFNGDVQSISYYRPNTGSYLIASPDSDSPYHIENTPALHCHEFDGEGKWEWRSVEISANKYVSHKSAESPLMTNEEKRSLRENYLFRKARNLTTNESISWSRMPQVGRYEGNMYMRFFKRGLSSVTQVAEFPQYVHLVSTNVSSEIGSHLKKFQLPDFETVILIPAELWNQSLHVTKGGDILASKYGITKIDRDVSMVAFIVAMFSLSLTRMMFAKWRLDLKFDFEVAIVSIINSFLTVDKLFPDEFTDTQKTQFLRVLTALVPGAVYGMVLTPKVSKIGTSSARSQLNHIGLEEDISRYNFEEQEFMDTDDYPSYFDTQFTSPIEPVIDEFDLLDKGVQKNPPLEQKYTDDEKSNDDVGDNMFDGDYETSNQ